MLGFTRINISNLAASLTNSGFLTSFTLLLIYQHDRCIIHRLLQMFQKSLCRLTGALAVFKDKNNIVSIIYNILVITVSRKALWKFVASYKFSCNWRMPDFGSIECVQLIILFINLRILEKHNIPCGISALSFKNCSRLEWISNKTKL